MHHPSSPLFLLENLPPIIGGAVHEVSNNVQAPLEMAASSALAAASYVCQFKADVVRQAHLVSPTSLNFITIAESGDRKTGCDRHFTKPINDFETSLQEYFEGDLARYRSDIEIWQIKRKTLLSKIQKLSHAEENIDEEEINLRKLENSRPKEPLLQKFIFGDVTPEALASRLEAWPSIGIISNEAGSILGTGSMQNLGMLNQIWDGSPPRTERISRKTKPIPIARLTVSLMVQPETFGAYLQKQGSLARSNGFLARALITQPQSWKGERFIYNSVEPTWEHLSTYQKRLTKILEDGYKEQCKENYRPIKLFLNHAAKQRWRDYSNEIERAIKPNGLWGDITDAASKAPEQAVRLAGIFHMIEELDGEIHDMTLMCAINVISYYLNQFKLVFGTDSPLSPLHRDAMALKDFILKKFHVQGVDKLSRSWIMKNGPEQLRSRERLHAALEVLYDMYVVRPTTIDKTHYVHVMTGII